MPHSNKPQAARVEVPLSFRRSGGGWKTQLVTIRDQGSLEANNAAAIQQAIKLGYSASEVEPFLTGE